MVLDKASVRPGLICGMVYLLHFLPPDLAETAGNTSDYGIIGFTRQLPIAYKRTTVWVELMRTAARMYNHDSSTNPLSLQVESGT